MPAKKAPSAAETMDVYRTCAPGVVIRRHGNNDESPLPRGTIINPASVDDPEDLERLAALGFVKKIAVRVAPSTAPAGRQRQADPEVTPQLPTKRTAYRSEIHHLSVRRSGSIEDALVRKGQYLPQDADQQALEHLIRSGYVTAVEIDY